MSSEKAICLLFAALVVVLVGYLFHHQIGVDNVPPARATAK
jgi:hypothetical protein